MVNKNLGGTKMGLTIKKANAVEPTAEAKVEAPVAEEAQAPVAQAADVVDETVNSMSDKVAFVAPLGNPLRDDVTSTKGEDGTTKKTITPFIVGYRMKALADLVVPDCGTTDNFKKNYMDYADINGKKEVKAGETFDLTPFEMAVLASQKEFNKQFTGGDVRAMCCFSRKDFPGGKAKDGAEVTVKEIPRAVLRLAEGSIKDMQYVLVCEKEMQMTEDGKQKRVGKVNPGFEKWAPLCKATQRTVGGARAASKGAANAKPTYDPMAAQFMAILRQKGLQQ